MVPLTTRLMTWNIRQGGGTRVPEILEALRALRPDVVVLTEFRANRNGETIRRFLDDQGLCSQHHPNCGARMNSVLVAGRDDCTFETFASDLGEHAHRCVVARFPGLSVVGVYFALNRGKRPLFHSLLSRSPSLLGGPCAIVGDFNTGLHGIDEAGAKFAEIRSFQELVTLGWVDAWRKVNGHAREYSWFSQKGNGFRIDHALCSPRLAGTVVGAQYAHTFREQGISDHSPLIVDFSAASALRLES